MDRLHPQYNFFFNTLHVPLTIRPPKQTNRVENTSQTFVVNIEKSRLRLSIYEFNSYKL